MREPCPQTAMEESMSTQVDRFTHSAAPGSLAGRKSISSVDARRVFPRFPYVKHVGADTLAQAEALESVAHLAPLVFGMSYAGEKPVNQLDHEGGVEPPPDLESALEIVAKLARRDGLTPKQVVSLFEGAITQSGVLEAAFPRPEGV